MRSVSESLKSKILRSLDAGAETSCDIAIEIGLPATKISAHLCNLVKAGVLMRKSSKFYTGRSGRPQTRFVYASQTERQIEGSTQHGE